MNWELFYQGVKIGLTVAIPIGPIALLCIRKSLTETFAVGLALALGIGTADAIYAILGALSISTITVLLQKYQLILELIGVAVILYLGVSALRHGTPKTARQECSTSTLFQTYFSIILITLTSPMTILLFAGVFAGIGFESAAANAQSIAWLTAGVFISTALWFTLLSAFVIFCRSWFNDRHVATINFIAGMGIIGFGLYRLVNILI